MKYPDENWMISEKQNGFRMGQSCLSSILVPCESWCAPKDQELLVDAAYIDFRKTLDKIPHNWLLYMLSNIVVECKLIM